MAAICPHPVGKLSQKSSWRAIRRISRAGLIKIKCNGKDGLYKYTGRQTHFSSAVLGLEAGMKWLAGSFLILTASMNLAAYAAPDGHASRDSVQIAQDRPQEQRRDGRGGGNPPGAPARRPQTRGPQAGPSPGSRPGPGPSARNRPGSPPRFEHGPPVYEKRAFQRNYLAPRRFRLGVYRSPPGWMYRRWMYGEYLPPAFWARSFWITSFWLYGLDRPPLGCEWVRYGSDALLIDVATGEILQVVYNAFY
jgi:Ni/Co efflux regulator RcnB